MWLLILRIFEVAFAILCFLGSVYAARLFGIAKAKDDLIEVTKNDKEAWKSRYEAEHLEYNEYREKANKHKDEKNDLVTRLTAENVELKNRTDLSPVVAALANQDKFNKEQSEINAKVVQTLDAILGRLSPKPKRLRHAPRV